MREYDLIVIGTGAGLNVASRARAQNLKVAIVEDGPLGGTCLNRGCIPSKILIEPANVVRQAEDAKRIGVTAKIESMDFQLVRKRMWDLVLSDRGGMEEGVTSDKGLDFYHTRGEFVGTRRLQVGVEQITAPKVMIACGVRTSVPKIKGLEEVGYLTSETVFDLSHIPSRLAILGGGYKACEFAHFFTAFGTQVTIIGRNPALLPREEPEVSALVLKKMSELSEVHVNHELIEAKRTSDGKSLTYKDRATGKESVLMADEILVATGVQSNADLLQVSRTGVQLDERGYVLVNEYLETNVSGIWAFGDIIGRNMYRHTANYESDVAWYNAFGKQKVKLLEHAVPHAVFAYPEVAGVGLTEAEAKQRGRRYFTGRAEYIDTAKGYAMAEEEGFCKVIVDAETMRILGAHAVGAHASLLVQPIVYLMNVGDGTFNPIARSQTIHPALSEVMANAFANLSDPEHHHEH
ncbi:MAG: dihydrolipoyl dehydrogenase [Methanomassiliicoccales archaeon]|nr:dihydrolipoyl dehydrogenase [Methanomassiliicoccales archaeon]MDD1755233.1 dihydrolipoyl dehydrogenase [Methanomassiliicoccales archaeon]